MSAEVLVSDPQRPDVEVVRRAAKALCAGELVIIPTETVYGIACRADDEEAVRRLFSVKRRMTEKALPLLLASAEALSQIALEVSESARRLAEAFMPGALTLVLRKRETISDLVTGGKPTVGVRVPDLPLARAILAACDAPVAATSANVSGERPAVTVADLPAELREAAALIVDGGPCAGGEPSTVLDVTVEPPAILREGPITTEMIAAVLRE